MNEGNTILDDAVNSQVGAAQCVSKTWYIYIHIYRCDSKKTKEQALSAALQSLGEVIDPACIMNTR